MLSFLIQNEINRTPSPETPKKAALKRGRPLGPKARQSRADAKYSAVLEDGPLPTGTIASKLGLSHAGCLCNLYSLEERKLIKRIKQPGLRSLKWELL